MGVESYLQGHVIISSQSPERISASETPNGKTPFSSLSHISWSWEAPSSHLRNSLDQDRMFCQRLGGAHSAALAKISAGSSLLPTLAHVHHLY